MPGAPGMPGMPVTSPQKRNNVGIILSVVLSIAVVAGLLIAGALALSQSHGNNTSNNPGGTAGVTNGATPTAANNNMFSDPLTSNANGWANDQHCFFRSDGYHIVGNGESWDCLAPTDVPDNFSVQVQVKQIAGPTNEGYGIAFRHVSAGNAYFLLIDGNGHWTIDKCVKQNCTNISNWASSGGAIHTGLNKQNTLEVVATGSHFVFSANGKKIGQVTDTTFNFGSVGLSGPGVSQSEVVYTDLIINQLGG
jgi:hypothetical protein